MHQPVEWYAGTPPGAQWQPGARKTRGPRRVPLLNDIGSWPASSAQVCLTAPAAGHESRRLQYPSNNQVDPWGLVRTAVEAAKCRKWPSPNALAPEVARHQ